MARIRSIKPEFFLHEDLAELSALHRLLFIGLWTLADKHGRLEDRPKRIKAALLPWDDCDVEALLADLAMHGFIVRYEGAVAGGETKRAIWIEGFEKHQKPHPKETAFDLPEPDLSTASREITRLDQDGPGNATATDAEQFRNHPESGGREIPRQAGSFHGEPGKDDGEQRGDGFFVSGNGGGDGSDLNGPPPVSPAPRPKAAPAAGGPVGELRDGIDAEFMARRGAAYEWTFLDERSLKAKIHHGTLEILRRWSIALRRTRYPTCNTVADLVKNWNAYAAEEEAGAGDQRRGRGQPGQQSAAPAQEIREVKPGEDPYAEGAA